MNTRLLVASALAVALLSGPFGTPAPAEPASQIKGGCGGSFTTDVLAGQGQATGVIDIAAVVYSTGTVDHNPVTATVTCYVTVNGTAQPEAMVSATGRTVVLGGGAATYTSASPDDDIRMCTSVEFSDATPASTTCDQLTTLDRGAACTVALRIDDLETGVGVRIGWDGDLWIFEDKYLDCPPYGNPLVGA